MPKKLTEKRLTAQTEAFQYQQYMKYEANVLFESVMNDIQKDKQAANERAAIAKKAKDTQDEAEKIAKKVNEDTLKKAKKAQDKTQKDAKEAQDKAQKDAKQEQDNAQKKLHANYDKALARKFGYRSLNELNSIDSKSFNEIHKDAKKGNIFSQFDIARCYEESILIKDKRLDSLECYKKILKDNIHYAPAQYRIALFYLNDQTPKKNLEQNAFRLLKKAAEAGHFLAQHDLAICYLRNIGVEPSMENILHAYFWFKQAQKAGYQDATLGLNFCKGLLTSYYVALDDSDFSSVNELIRQVEAKMAKKNSELAFETMESVTKKFEKYKKIALLNKNTSETAKSKFNLARSFMAGIPDEKSAKNAFSFLKEAAELNYVPAQYYLSELYYSGKMKEKPSGAKTALAVQMLKWLENAAAAGYSVALRRLGLLYKNQIGFPDTLQNRGKAFCRFMRASFLGDEIAKSEVIWCFENKFGIPNKMKRNWHPELKFSKKMAEFNSDLMPQLPVAVSRIDRTSKRSLDAMAVSNVARTETAANAAGTGIAAKVVGMETVANAARIETVATAAEIGAAVNTTGIGAVANVAGKGTANAVGTETVATAVVIKTASTRNSASAAAPRISSSGLVSNTDKKTRLEVPKSHIIARASYPLNAVAPVTAISTTAPSTIPPLVRTASSSLTAKLTSENGSNNSVRINSIKKRSHHQMLSTASSLSKQERELLEKKRNERKQRAEIAAPLTVANKHFSVKNPSFDNSAGAKINMGGAIKNEGSNDGSIDPSQNNGNKSNKSGPAVKKLKK